MLGVLWIALVVVAVGIVLYIGERRWRNQHALAEKESGHGNKADNTENVSEASGSEPVGREPVGREASGSEAEQSETEDGECCGLHLVCEKDSLSPMSSDIIYYDDEELDRFIGRSSESYTPEETEEFRDVLMTLLPEDVAGWARSVTQRRLELPPEVRDELLMLVNEQRAQR